MSFAAAETINQTGHYLIEVVGKGQGLLDGSILDGLGNDHWLIDKGLIGEIVEEDVQ